MLLNLTDLSDEPLQSQIIRQIRAKILNGDLVAGEGIPSIRGLARDNHISVITVQRAYENLERQDLIHSRRGKGFFVSDLDNSKKRELAEKKFILNIEPIIESALSEGLNINNIQRIIDKILEKDDN